MNARKKLEQEMAYPSDMTAAEAAELLAKFETEIRKDIAADIRAAAPKYLDSDVDVHVWHVLDGLSNKVEHPDKDNA